jgi:DNA polymerase-3 subunit delta
MAARKPSTLKPKQFLQSMKAGEKPAAGYLFLGAETFFRDRCRKSLEKAVLGGEASEDSLIRIDLKEQPLARVLDEARTLSLFATSRLVVVANAENALPSGRSAKDSADAAKLAAYFKDPSPGVVLAFESIKFDARDRDDQAKLERVAQFFVSVPVTVEMDRLTPAEALKGCALLARNMGLDIDNDTLAELVEMLGADMARLEGEMQKLQLYAEPGRPVTRADIETLVPEARQSGVFELTDALARKQRDRALRIVATLNESGAYWPMQVTLLASLFRQALAVKESGARSAKAAMDALARSGVRTWFSRAQQLVDTAQQFTRTELENALLALYEADKALRSPRPDDRLIMENLLLKLTANRAARA